MRMSAGCTPKSRSAPTALALSRATLSRCRAARRATPTSLRRCSAASRSAPRPCSRPRTSPPTPIVACYSTRAISRSNSIFPSSARCRESTKTSSVASVRRRRSLACRLFLIETCRRRLVVPLDSAALRDVVCAAAQRLHRRAARASRHRQFRLARRPQSVRLVFFLSLFSICFLLSVIKNTLQLQTRRQSSWQCDQSRRDDAVGSPLVAIVVAFRFLRFKYICRSRLHASMVLRAPLRCAVTLTVCHRQSKNVVCSS